jgi:hypothetical protein
MQNSSQERRRNSAPEAQQRDEVAAATTQLSSNAAGYARVTIRPLLTAEEMDKAVAKWPPSALRNNNRAPLAIAVRNRESGSGNGR